MSEVTIFEQIAQDLGVQLDSVGENHANLNNPFLSGDELLEKARVLVAEKGYTWSLGDEYLDTMDFEEDYHSVNLTLDFKGTPYWVVIEVCGDISVSKV